MIAEVTERRAELHDLCRRFGVRRLDLFGSAARGDFDPACSDLDFLVEFEPKEPGGYADAYFGLKESLERLFGRSVDLVSPASIRNPWFRESVEETRSVLYARDARKYLFDIRQAAESTGQFVRDRAFSDYMQDPMLRSAVERQFEIIGEALTRFSRIAPD